MRKIKKLSEIIEFNSGFRNAINLYLSLNKQDKILSYIPTQSSVRILTDYLNAVYRNIEQATILIGPYGKGKSHLLLVLLAIISMERNETNRKLIEKLLDRISGVEEIGQNSAELIESIWSEKGRFLPVIITDLRGDLNQSFLYALHEALKREGLDDLVPDTYYSIAVDKIEDWKDNYPKTYKQYEETLKGYGKTVEEIIVELKLYSKNALEIFSDIYPKITSGSDFNPLTVSEVLPLYKSISEKLYELGTYSGIYIIFDEFSKFIEGQDKLYTGNNMKLLQDMCELATDSSAVQVFITLVAHKSIKEYGKYLSTEIINAFTGIEGRLEEKYFITSFKNNYELIQNAIKKDESQLKYIPKYEIYLGKKARDNNYQLLPFKTNFDKENFEKIIFKGCYPLTPISAYLLLNISEKVAQNERTLFTFISKDEQYSMARFVMNHEEGMPWNINADLIYDYFSSLFKRDILNEFVHNEWLNAEYALSKCFEEEERKVIKSLAIILIVNKEEELPGTEKVLSLASGVSDVATIITHLVDEQVIYKKGSTNCYVFKTRAGSALKLEIKKRREIKGNSVNLPKVLLNITDKYFVIPKKYNTNYMMTRYFRHEYMEVGEFLNIYDSSALFGSGEFADGKVITLYSLDNKKEKGIEIKERIALFENRKLIIIYSPKNFGLMKQARDYEIVQELKENHVFIDHNEILKRELLLLEEDLSKELFSHIESIFEENKQCKVFFYNGIKVEELPGGEEENAVNRCCEMVYSKTPIINNELINRQKIGSTQTKKARKVIIDTILNHKDDEKFYTGSNQEATIYRSLFKVTHIINGMPEAYLKEILNNIHSFIDSCSDHKRPLTSLIEILTHEPYGMRAGIIPIYVSYVLSKRKEDIIIYFISQEVQITADIIINMCEFPDDYWLFISKEDVQKERYIKELQELFQVDQNYNLSDSRIKDLLTCVQRWFRSLPQVSRNSVRYDNSEDKEENSLYIQKLKSLLQKADANPYEVIFVKIPSLFSSIDNLEKVFVKICLCKKVLDEYYNWTIEKAVNITYDIFDKKRKEDLFHAIKGWYDKQSEMSKRGLSDGRLNNFMTCIEKINIYDDIEITKKLVKAVMDIYLENWNDDSIAEYEKKLMMLKSEAESIQNYADEGKLKLSFIGKNGKEIDRFYSRANENIGSVLRNILSDTLDEFDDLSVNDRVAILLEMVEKVIE